jgi:hypothetical protein
MSVLTLRNCSFVDPTGGRTSMDMLARTNPALGPHRPWSARALVGTRDRLRVLRVGVLILTLTGMERSTAIDVDWLDRVFSDQEGVAAFVRRMSGGRRYLEWQAFGPVELMTPAQKASWIAKGALGQGNREAARARGIPVDAFDHWMWLTDEGLSNAGTTSGADSFMGTKDFTVSVATHELMHRLNVDGHADVRAANDYADGYCIMGDYGRAFVDARLATSVAPPVRPIAGPGLSAPYAREAGWLDLNRNTVAAPLRPGVGARFDLYANQGAPIPDDDRTVAAVLGPRPVSPQDPGQVWIEYRRARGFDQAIDGRAVASPGPGVVHVSRVTIDPPGPALNPGKVRTFLIGMAPALAGARMPEFEGFTPRVEVVSTEAPLVRVVLDGPARHAYLFKSGTYVRYDRQQDRADQGYPLPIDPYWQGMAAAGFATDLDAVLPWFGSRLYFFKGSSYVRYDLRTDRVDAGYPRPVAGSWPGLGEAGFGSDLDAAVNWGDGFAYFFKGDRYVRYHAVADRLDGGPYRIADRWSGLAAAGFDRDLDACVAWGDGIAYFLKGDRYLAYDMLAGGVMRGPRAIGQGWPGLAAAGYAQGVKAAFCAPPPEA